MRRLDRDASRFKRSMKRLSPANRIAVTMALDLFLKEPIPPWLDFKKCSGSRYFTIRAGPENGNVRIAMRRDDDDPELFIVVFVGNHDDLESLDAQGR